MPYYREKFEALENSDNLTPSQLAREIKILLLENTKKSNIREKKKTKEDQQNSEPWFDSECKKLKNDIRSTGNKIRKAPMNQDLRLALRNEKQSFKRTIMKKKKLYKGNMMSLLESKRNEGT